ncbi:ImmA/IrrE family metallo-endopeptidase [Paenibacillus sp. HJGM_3]|uniref:ImmA/IrrE family metallo-endopeptidase n=1 Tax=Paenibacillus sp. HJGM_3 TaxID=3379816 RepID=UPI003859F5D5
MDLSLYRLTEIEQWVNQKYIENGIKYASDMDLDRIASIFNSVIHPTKDVTRAIYDHDLFGLVLLNSFHSAKKQRLNFFHELCHILRHSGDQNKMPKSFVDLQEEQATCFQNYAALPVFLLEQYNYIQDRKIYIKTLADDFSLPLSFVVQRIEQIERRILQAMLDRELVELSTPAKVEFDYYPETHRILAQLYRQISLKGASGRG